MSKQSKITYLFGAGASAGNQALLDDIDLEELEGIPVVKGFNTDIKKFLETMGDYKSPTAFQPKNRPKRELAVQFHEKFTPLFNEFKNIFSFDTYAKKLYESEELDKLQELKILLKSYLVYRQYLSHRDKRYDLFFATLIDDRSIKSNVNILSWNYDTQIEMSISSFTSKKKSPTIKHMYFDFLPPFINKDMPVCIKLNGCISNQRKDDYFSFAYFEHDLLVEEDAIIKVLDYYEIYLKGNGNDDSIEFSWEKSKHKEAIGEKLYNIVEHTDVLVVIGYSFPTLNRKKDADIIGRLPERARIYVQCRDDHFENIKTRIETFLPMPIVNGEKKIFQVKMIDEFYIPPELN